MAALSPIEVIYVLIALAGVLAILAPLNGVLVRFRVNYSGRKSLQLHELDSNGTAAPRPSPIVKTYYDMFRRVDRLEGVAGLFKGSMPTVIQILGVTILVALFVDPRKSRWLKARAPIAEILISLLYTSIMLIATLPIRVISNRAIITPMKLGYLNPGHALRVLLTATELKRPWTIYFTPGLLAAEALHSMTIVFILGPLRRGLLPQFSKACASFDGVSAGNIALYTVSTLFITAIITPLEVIATRLSVQRNGVDAEYSSIQQNVDGPGREEVVGLRDKGDPYLGFADCAKRIIHEEGVMTLYRGWWLTFLWNWGTTFI
ncbi:mitochondrial carrier [Coprinopsis marcescibilis]|uniref:Mitochondrial carrier n=1 Tax=Coprinopsis marcescibilis TaxID=230819 RepID=A0A5C3L0T4_COPMA|nr:mitochondrial carrier [Coprinopsis marcescibilis]